MKNKNHHHITVHQRLERLAHHHIVLTCILTFMGLSFLKYETQFFHIFEKAYHEGFGLVSSYAHHDEVTRMPVQYGSSLRAAPISGE
jgi:hypothetical protein